MVRQTIAQKMALLVLSVAPAHGDMGQLSAHVEDAQDLPDRDYWLRRERSDSYVKLLNDSSCNTVGNGRPEIFWDKQKAALDKMLDSRPGLSASAGRLVAFPLGWFISKLLTTSTGMNSLPVGPPSRHLARFQHPRISRTPAPCAPHLQHTLCHELSASRVRSVLPS